MNKEGGRGGGGGVYQPKIPTKRNCDDETERDGLYHEKGSY